MKKTITFIAIAAAFMFGTQALAATTASLTPGNINVSAGQAFSVTVAINPNGTSNFAEKVELKFDPAIVEFTSFSFNGNWTALNQPGYDVVNNTSGSVVKTAGYANGFTTNTVFGTASFRAKTAGSANILIGSNSEAFEADSQKAISGTGAHVTVSPVSAKPQVTAQPVVKTAVATATASTSTPKEAQAAAAADAIEKSNTTLKVLLGIAILIIIGLTYAVFRKGRTIEE